jgi:tetratricopeptide (TPR) repeat protein
LIRTIAFWIPDKRELGLRQLEFAIDHGLYAPNEASYALVAAYFDCGQYEKAMSIYDRTIARKRVLTVNDLYYKARLLIKFGRWSDVESLFRRILQQLEDAEFASVGYQVECKYWIASALVTQHRSFEALQLLRDAIAQSAKRNPSLELQGPFESFTEIKKRLEKLERLQEESDKVKSIYSSPRGNPLSIPCSYPFPSDDTLSP